MKERIPEIISALILGVGSCHLYFLFSGIAATITIGLLKSTGRVPHPFRMPVYWSYLLVQDIIFALPVIALACIIGACFIKHSARLYGFLIFIGFLVSYIHYHIFIFTDFGLGGPLWMLLSKGVIIALLFIYSTQLVFSLKQR